MAVVKMKKLSVLAHKRDADRLIRRLLRLRCVEIRQAEQSEDSLIVTGGDGAKCAEIERRIGRVTEAISSLSKYSEKKKGLVGSRISVRLDKFSTDGSYAKATEIVENTIATETRLSELKAEESRLTALIASLLPWERYDTPLDFEGTERTSVFTVTMPSSVSDERIEEALGDIPASLIRVGGDKVTGCFALICHRDSEDEAIRVLGSLGMLKAPFEGMKGSVTQNISLAKKKLSSIGEERQKCVNTLRELAKNLELVEILYDVENTTLTAEQSKEKLAQTELCVLLDGWIPENEAERVKTSLSKFQCAVEIEEPDEGEEPPVLLHNNFFARTFEWVLGMYSYPKYGAFDPTFIMSIFYFIMFGMMFADVGYGFILTVACFGALKLLNPRKGMRNFLAMFGYCGISSMIMGVLFGAYFGNLPQAFSENMLGVEGATSTMQTAVLFDPLLKPMEFLILSLAVGAVHLVTGMALNFIALCKKGQWADALCVIATWWLTFAGIGLAVLFPWGKYVAIAGVASIVLTGGRHEKNVVMKLGKGIIALYGVVNYAADLLSYSRILALGLAASVIAQVVNTMGTMGGPTVVGFIMMVVVFIIGHLLNLVINVLGTFVHTSRLQYIEFFGKFYEDGGVPFVPAEPSDKYTTEQ